MKNSKNILLLVGLIIVAVFIFLALSGKLPQTKNTPTTTVTTYSADLKTFMPVKMTLFYSDTCPHCKNVSDFIEKNNLKTKIDFDEKEVSNQDNVQALLAVVQTCELPQDNIGVPFLWTGSECLSGDVDIINFFENYNK